MVIGCPFSGLTSRLYSEFLIGFLVASHLGFCPFIAMAGRAGSLTPSIRMR